MLLLPTHIHIITHERVVEGLHIAERPFLITEVRFQILPVPLEGLCVSFLPTDSTRAQKKIQLHHHSLTYTVTEKQFQSFNNYDFRVHWIKAGLHISKLQVVSAFRVLTSGYSLFAAAPRRRRRRRRGHCYGGDDAYNRRLRCKCVRHAF